MKQAEEVEKLITVYPVRLALKYLENLGQGLVKPSHRFSKNTPEDERLYLSLERKDNVLSKSPPTTQFKKYKLNYGQYTKVQIALLTLYNILYTTICLARYWLA